MKSKTWLIRLKIQVKHTLEEVAKPSTIETEIKKFEAEFEDAKSKLKKKADEELHSNKTVEE